MRAVRLQQDLRAALRTWHKRLKDASADHIHGEIRLGGGWIGSQPALRAILAEAAQAEPGLHFGAGNSSCALPTSCRHGPAGPRQEGRP
jgi:hypothetical protein